MKREDDQQLWDLLGNASGPELSPFFARNVVRAIRQQPQRFNSLRTWLSLRKLIPITGIAVVVIAAMMTLRHPAVRDPVDNPPDVIAQIEPQDYDVVADLDELLVTDENTLWDDNTQTL